MTQNILLVAAYLYGLDLERDTEPIDTTQEHVCYQLGQRTEKRGRHGLFEFDGMATGRTD